MNVLPVTEARRRFAELLEAAERGEQFTLTRHGVPVAVLGPASESSASMVAEVHAEYAAATVAAPAPSATVLGAPERLFASPAIRAVLSQFVLHPDREFYQRDLARRAGVALRSAQLALRRLENLGLIESYRSGNRVQYRAVPSPAFDSLRHWALPEVSLVPLLREALEPLGDAIEMAFVYGSTAAGEDTATSDIDLMVVGNGDTYDVLDALDAVEGTIGREINVTRYAPDEFAEKVRAGSHFLTTVLGGPLLWVLGGREVKDGV